MNQQLSAAAEIRKPLLSDLCITKWVQGILRSNPKIQVDEESGKVLFEQEILTSESFAKKMTMMAELALFLNRAYLQLIHKYPNGGA